MRRARLVQLLLALAAAFAMVAAGCGDDDENGGGGGGGGGLDTITAGTLTVGSDIPFKPLEFGRAPDYDGFDVELVRDVGRRLGLEVKFVKTPFDTIFRDLAQGKFDLVASATTITPEREKTVDFSIPYFQADQSLLVARGSDIKAIEDLEGKAVGAQLATTGADYAKDRTGAESVRTYDLADDAINALAAGQVEAVIIDFPVAFVAQQEKQGFEVTRIKTGEQYGLAFAKDSARLRQSVNDALNKMKSDGTYTRLYRKWFDEAPPRRILETSAGS